MTPAAIQVHAFTGVQLLLKSASRQLRERIALLSGGCLPSSASRPNLFGALLGELLKPADPLLHAVRWTLGKEGREQPLHLALHVRALSDWRAGNLSQWEVDDAIENAARCIRREASLLLESNARRRPIRAVVVSSSPEVRASLERRLRRRGRTKVRIEVVTFDWVKFLGQAPPEVTELLQASEEEVSAFCRTVDQTQAFRCNRTAHIRDWGPEPHWVALVELLRPASARVAVVGGGYPYFKVCNTFTQIAASLADASPPWLHESPPPSRVRLICASRRLSTDWGSSVWRALGTQHNGSTKTVIDCGKQSCLPVPLHPELWPDMRQPACSPGSELRDRPLLPAGHGGSEIHLLQYAKSTHTMA